MKYPNCKNCVYNDSLRCFECDWGSKFEEKRTAKERMADLKLALDNVGSSGKKLIGSITEGYRYVNEDVANTYTIAREAIAKAVTEHKIGDFKIRGDYRGGTNFIYEPKKEKEEIRMKAIDIYNLTRNNGMATITAGDTSIPVRITDVEHESRIYSADTTTITCEVQHVPAPLARRAPKVAAKKRSDLIKNVYFNAPVTVVIWTDGSKTIVKANGDEPYDPEKGLAMAIAKKFMGDNETKSNYYDVFKKWLPKEKMTVYVKKTLRETDVLDSSGKSVVEILFPERWKIWVTTCDLKTGAVINRSIYPRDYATKYAAERAAKRMYGPNPIYTKWIVSKTNPWETEEK